MDTAFVIMFAAFTLLFIAFVVLLVTTMKRTEQVASLTIQLERALDVAEYMQNRNG